MKRDRAWQKAAAIGGLAASLLVAAGGGTITGCDPEGTGGSGGSGGGGSGGGGGGGGEPVDPVRAACVGDIRIGKVEKGACPDPDPPDSGKPPSGWKRSKLFQATDPAEPALDGYCMYTWKDDTTQPTPETLPVLDGVPGAKSTDSDCAAVAALGLGETQAITELLAGSLWSSFTQQIDAPSGLPPAAGPGRVRVAVIDSWPSDAAIGQLPHGFGMAGIADGLTCRLFAPGGTCPVETTPHLALNLLAPRERDNMEGGYFGHFGRLARQIQDAVLTWKAAAVTPDDRLVINLSVGWDPVFNQPDGGGPISPVAAVRDAIEWATCEGVLVIAAAGNTSGGAVPGDGPTFPAAWADQPAKAGCAACPPGVTCPLLYAVGGVDGASRALSNARAGSRPLLAAPAFAVPGLKDLGAAGGATEIVGPFTGSSVAAAGVAGAAAMVWAHDTDLGAKAVMDRLYATGVDLGVPADFCLAQPCGNVFRVSLCAALAATGVPLTCDPPKATDDLNPTVSTDQQTVIEAKVDPPSDLDGTGLSTTEGDAVCGDVLVDTAVAERAVSACPLTELPTSLLNVAIDPQPGPNPCPPCTMFLNETEKSVVLDMAIEERLLAPVYAQVLTLLDGETVVARFDLANATRGIPMVAGETYRVSLPWFAQEYRSDWYTAMVEWLDETEATSKTSQLIVTVQP